MHEIARRILAWYDDNGRSLPWRVRGKLADPYTVWLSEIMLQQTTAAAVIPYYEKFIRSWPDVHALAGAVLDDILAAWAGLGYYARARNLHKAARTVAGAGGRFPDTLDGLMALPGVGAYTAAAIGAIAFGIPAAAMDANAERVVARLFAVDTPLPAAKPVLAAKAAALVPTERPGDFAQALMDLGAGPCSSSKPDCALCPLAKACLGRKSGIAESLPVKVRKPPKPLKRGVAFVVRDDRGRVLLLRRPERGLLGGMWQPPLGPWGADFPAPADVPHFAPVAAQWRRVDGVVRHVFTHFVLELQVFVGDISSADAAEGCVWAGGNALTGYGIPTVMCKVLALAGISVPRQRVTAYSSKKD